MNLRIITLITVFLLCAGIQMGCAQQGGTKSDLSQQIADRIVDSEVPVLVDFWAAWCMPCRFLDPIIEDLEKEYKGKVNFVKVDVDVHRTIAAYFQVSAVPSVFIIEDKTVRAALNGVRDKKTYKEAIDSALKLAAERKKKAPPADKQVCLKDCD